MYISAVDERNGLAVWLPSDPTAAEWEEHFADVEKIVGWSKKLGFRPGVVLLANAFARPDARNRKRLAEITGRPDYDPYLAFVSSNAMLRGLLTMLGWMHAKPSYEIDYLADEASGCAWIESRRPGTTPALRSLIAGVRIRAGRAAPRAASG
jgi:hypothetical protein